MKSLLPLCVLAIFLFGCVGEEKTLSFKGDDPERCPEGCVCLGTVEMDSSSEGTTISGNRTNENSSLAVGESKAFVNKCGLEIDGVCQNETITKTEGNCIYSKDEYGNSFTRCDEVIK